MKTNIFRLNSLLLERKIKMENMDDVQINQDRFNFAYQNFFNGRMSLFIKGVNAKVARCSQTCINDATVNEP